MNVIAMKLIEKYFVLQMINYQTEIKTLNEIQTVNKIKSTLLSPIDSLL